MKKKTKDILIMSTALILAVILTVILGSCTPSFTGYKSQNETIPSDCKVEYLFSQDDVNVYRFYDKGYWRYLTTGNGSYLPQKQVLKRNDRYESWIDGAE